MHCVFQGLAERATILVHQLPLKGQTNKNTGHAMTSTLQSVQEQYADSHTGSASVLSWATANSNVLNTKLRDHPHWSQLNGLTFEPVTLVQLDKLDQLLVDHPNRPIVNYVFKGFYMAFH